MLGGLRHSEPLLRRLLNALPGGIRVCAYLTGPDPMPADLRAAVLVAASPADLTARCQVVFAMQDDLASLESRLHNPSGVRAGVHSPTILIICSILPPDSLRDLALVLHARTAGLLRVVDAPVLGPPKAVAVGRYSMIIGAAPTIYRAVRPVLELLGPCTRIGGVGTAQIAKACEQFVLAATTLAAIEASAISLRAGIDLRTVPGWGRLRKTHRRCRSGQHRSTVPDPRQRACGPRSRWCGVKRLEVRLRRQRWVRVGELLTVLMDDRFGTTDLYTAGHHLIALEDGSGHDHLGSDPTMRP